MSSGGDDEQKRDELEKKTLLSVDGRFRFRRDVGLGDKLASSLVIASLFAVVEYVDVEPGERGENAREVRLRRGKGTWERWGKIWVGWERDRKDGYILSPSQVVWSEFERFGRGC